MSDASARPLITWGRASRLLWAAAILLAFKLNVDRTWQTWGDLIVDCGREVDTPKQLAAGKMLYRDVRYWYGPAVPYFHAGLYRLFGVRLNVLTTAGLGVALLLGVVVYRTVRLFAGRMVAGAAAIGFFQVNAFAHLMGLNIFNFALPYAYPATYGMLFACASVFFLLRHVRKNRTVDSALACLFLVLTGLCKVEVLAAVLAAHGVFLAVTARGRRANWLRYAVGYAIAFTALAGTYGFFRWKTGPGLWTDNLFVPGNVGAQPFVLAHSGLDKPAEAAGPVMRSLGVFIAWLLIALAGAWLERKASRTGVIPAEASPNGNENEVDVGPMLRGAIWVACFAGAVLIGRSQPINVVFRAVPFVIFAGLVACAIRRVRVRNDDLAAMGIVMCAFAIGAAARLGLLCSAEHYGFYLLVPAWICLAGLLGGMLPRWTARGQEPSGAVTAAAAGLLGSIAWSHLAYSWRADDYFYGTAKRFHIATPAGSLYCPTPYVGTVDRVIQFLMQQPAGSKVIALPEGAMIPFLAGCSNGIGVHTYLPMDLSGSYDERGLIERLAKSPPDFVLITARNTGEYGAREFGTDYGHELDGWIQSRYDLVEQYSVRDCWIHILRRR